MVNLQRNEKLETEDSGRVDVVSGGKVGTVLNQIINRNFCPKGKYGLVMASSRADLLLPRCRYQSLLQRGITFRPCANEELFLADLAKQ